MVTLLLIIWTTFMIIITIGIIFLLIDIINDIIRNSTIYMESICTIIFCISIIINIIYSYYAITSLYNINNVGSLMLYIIILIFNMVFSSILYVYIIYKIIEDENFINFDIIKDYNWIMIVYIIIFILITIAYNYTFIHFSDVILNLNI